MKYIMSADERILNYMSTEQLKDIIKELIKEIERLEFIQQESSIERGEIIFKACKGSSED